MKTCKVLVESFKVPGGSSPDAEEILVPLSAAVRKYGIKNVRVYIDSNRDKWGNDVESLKICCYN